MQRLRLETKIKIQMNIQGIDENVISEEMSEARIIRELLLFIIKHKNLALVGILVFLFSGLLVVNALQSNTAQAATTGQVYPTLGTTASETPWSDNNWTTPTNIYSDNAATANVTATSYDSPDQTWVLKATGFNFSAIPDGSTINGITVRTNAWYRSGQGSGSLDLCQLLDVSRAKVGTNLCSTPTALTTTNTTIITKGDSANLWGNSLTTAWIKDPDFGVALGMLATAANADVDIDYVTIEIDYTAPTITISGTCDGYDQTTDCVDGVGTVKVAVNGVVDSGSDATFSSGAWSFTMNQPTSGQSVVVFLDGAADADEATAVTLYDGSGNIDNVRLYKQQVTIGTDSGSANSGQTITLANMDDYDVTNDEDVFYDANLSAGTCNGVASSTGLCIDANTTSGSSSQEKLNILNLASNNFAPAGNVFTHDLVIAANGTFTGNGSTHRISGSWTDTGTFTPSTSTITFTATGTGETITTTGSTFNNLTFNGTGGGWTLQDSTTVSGILTITNGNFNAGSGTTLTLSNTGTPLVVSGLTGKFTAGTSTVVYTGNGATISSAEYYNLEAKPSSSSVQVLGLHGNTNASFDTGAVLPYGMTEYNGFLWWVESTFQTGSDWVRKYNLDGTSTGNNYDIESISGGGNTDANGITYYGGYFWVIDSEDQIVYQYNASDLSYVGPTSIANASCEGQTGVVYDSFTDAFWTIAQTDAVACKWSTSWVYTGTQFTTTNETVSPRGITSRNGYFYITENGGVINKYTSSGSFVTSFSTTSTGNDTPRGILAYNGQLYVSDITDGEYYKYYIDVSVSNNMVVGDGANAGADATLHNPNVTVGMDLTIATAATFTSGAGVVTVGDDLTETTTGAYSASTGNTVAFNTASATTIDGGSDDALTFYNLTVTTAGKDLLFTAGETYTTNGTITITGTAGGGNDVSITSTTGSSVYNFNHQGSAEAITYLTLNYLKCHASSNVITLGTGSVDGGTNDISLVDCLDFPAAAITVSGTVYLNDGTTADTTGPTLYISTGGGTADSTVANGSGVFTFSNYGPPTAGNMLTIWIGGGSVFGTTVIKYGTSCTGNPDCTGLSVIRNAVTLYSKNGTNITNDDLMLCDHDDGGFGCGTTDIGFNIDNGTTAMVVSDGHSLNIVGNTTYAPGYAVTTSVSNDGTDSVRDGDIGVESGSTLSMGTNALSVGGDFGSLGVMSKSATQTTTFTATAVGHTIHNNYSNWENVVLNGTNGGWSFGSSSGTAVIDGDLTVTAGTLSGTLPVTVSGGDVTGDGDINITGGTFTVTVNPSDAGSFGGNTDWDFNALTFSSSSGSQSTTGAGTGSITTSANDNALTISTSHTLVTNSKTFIFTGTGTPFVATGALNATGSVFRYLGNGATIASGSNGGSSISYHSLEAKPNGATPQVLGNSSSHTINVSNLLEIGNGTNAGASGATNNPIINTAYLTINNGATYTTGSGTLTVSGCVNNTFSRGATGAFDASTNNTVVFSCTNTTGQSSILSSAMTGTNAFYNLTIDGDGGGDTFTTGVAFDVLNDFTISTGDIISIANDVAVTGNVTGDGVINATAGLFTHNNTTSKNFGGNSNWTFQEIYLANAAGITAATGTGSITLTVSMFNDTGHDLVAGNKTWIFTGDGAVLSMASGDFDMSGGTSTFSYRGTSTNTIAPTIYDNLEFAPPSGTPTYTLYGNVGVGGNFTIGGAGNVTVDVNTNDAVVDIDGNITIGSGDTYSASNSAAMTVAGDWANSGTFTHNNNTVTLDATATGRTVTSGSSNFYSLTFDGTGGEWTLQDNPTISNVLTLANGNLIADDQTITLTGANSPFVKSGGTFTQGTSTVNYTSESTTTVLGLNGSGATDAYYNLGVGTNYNLTNTTYGLGASTTINNVLTIGSNLSDGNTDTFSVSTHTLTLKGSTTPIQMYTGGKSAFDADPYAGAIVIFASPTGTSGGLSTIDMTGTNDLAYLRFTGAGTFNIGSNIDFDAFRLDMQNGTNLAGSGNDITIYGFVEGTGTGDISLTGGTFTYTGGSYFNNIADWDFYNLTMGNGSAGSPYMQSTGAITVANVFNVTANTSFSVQSGYDKTINLTGIGTPFVLSGTFAPGEGRVNYNGAGATNITAATYYNLGILPGANSATHTLGNGTFTVGATLTLGNGTNTGVIVTGLTNNPTIDLNGTGTSLDLKANTTFISPATFGLFTVAGSWANAGTFTHSGSTITFDATSTGKTIQSNGSQWNHVTFSGSGGGWSPSDAMVLAGDLTVTAGTFSGTQNVTVNGGDVTGSSGAVINMTGGTFLIDGTGTFGSGITDTSFSNITFGDGSGIATTTITNSPAIVVSGVMTIAANQTLADASASAITFTAAGTPFVISGTYNNTGFSNYLRYTSTTGVTALASTPLTGSAAPYDIRINGTGTFNAGVAVEARNAIEVQAGTLAMGSNNLTIGSTALSSSGRLRVTSGQSITQDASASTTILAASGTSCIGASGASCTGTPGTITLGDLILGNGTNTFTTNLAGTTPTMTADSITITTNNTFNAGTASIINLTGNGTVLTPTGTFNTQTSTINFNSTGTSGTTVPALTYYNLGVNRDANSFTSAGNITVTNNLVITDGTFIAPADTLTLNNTLTINSNDSTPFNANSGIVLLTPISANNKIVTINGSSDATFNDITNTTTGSTVKFANGRTYAVAGDLTLTGISKKPIWIISDSAGLQWVANLSGNGSLEYVRIRDSACSGSNMPKAETVFNMGNNGSCWGFIIRGSGQGGVDGGAGSGGSGGGSGGQGGGGGGGSSQATATANMQSQAVNTVTVNNGGSGYLFAPAVCFQSATGSGATATATISGGSVTAINVTNGGSGYQTTPTVGIAAPPGDGGSGCSGGGTGGSGGGGGGSP